MLIKKNTSRDTEADDLRVAYGNVFWITGLSGAGKTTICRKFVNYLRGIGQRIVMLDGDELRAVMGVSGNTYMREDRLKLAKRYAQLCHVISSQGVDVAIATISMFHEIHDWNRKHLPGYFEIFLDVPLSVLARRDSKEIYSSAKNGEMKDVAGIHFSIEPPLNPDIHIKWTEGMNPDITLKLIIERLNEKKDSAQRDGE